MKKNELLHLLEDLLEMDKGGLCGDERLRDLNGWDSLAIVGFIALVDKHFNLEVPAHAVTAAETVGDLVGLLGSRVEN